MTTSSSWVAPRSTRNSVPPSARTRTAVMRASPPRPPGDSSTRDVPPRNEVPATPPARVLIVGCGALGRELVTLTRHLPGVDVSCLPAELHNRPERIPAAVADRITARGGDYDRVFVAYADCGTAGRLDAAL